MFDAEWTLVSGLKTAETIIINGMPFLAAQQRFVFLIKHFYLVHHNHNGKCLIFVFALGDLIFLAYKKKHILIFTVSL